MPSNPSNVQTGSGKGLIPSQDLEIVVDSSIVFEIPSNRITCELSKGGAGYTFWFAAQSDSVYFQIYYYGQSFNAGDTYPLGDCGSIRLQCPGFSSNGGALSGNYSLTLDRVDFIAGSFSGTIMDAKKINHTLFGTFQTSTSAVY
jgi:hypothetical protein